MLDDLGLVHMNGRIYDPLLGRFLSADLQVQFPGSLQSYNRYSYVQNNPLTFTDPTGWGFSPSAAANGWDFGVSREHLTVAEQHAVNSGFMAAPFTFIVNSLSLVTQAAVLSSGGPLGSPANSQMFALAQTLKGDTQTFLAESRGAIMKADGVDPNLAGRWTDANRTGEIMLNLSLTLVPMLKELPAAELRLTDVAPQVKLWDSVPKATAAETIPFGRNMATVERVASRAGVGLDGVDVQIINDAQLEGRGLFGWTDGKQLHLYPDAFESEEQLVKTLGHERTHVFQVDTFGPVTDSATLQLNEAGARAVEDSYWQYYLTHK
jgi:RHS repeat-associated protein